MEVLFFILDTACNRACPYCFYETGHFERKPNTMSAPDWTKLTDQAGEEGVRNIVITGGEPLMGGEKRMELLEKILKKTNYHGMEALLLTNGDFLSPKAAKRLSDAGLKAVSISQDSLTGIEGYKIRGWKATEAALKTGMRVTLIMTITRENFTDLPAIYRFAAARRLGLILQPAFIPKSHPRFEELSLEIMRPEHKKRILAAISQWAEGFGISDYPQYIKTLLDEPAGPRPARCYMGSMAAVIDCDGSFLPCFHRRDLCVGNVTEEPLNTLIKRVKAISADIADAPCWGMHCLSLFAGS